MLQGLVDIHFGIKRWYYQIRYPRVRFGRNVIIRGRLTIKGPLHLSIGDNCRIGKPTLIEGKGAITIGKNVLINGAWIYAEQAVTIGDDCLISDCFIVDTDFHNLEPHLRHAPAGPKVTAPIRIGRNVWVGARATVMKGVQIGDDSVVGLASVVRKSVPAGVVVIGNPQQIVKQFAPQPLAAPGAEYQAARLAALAGQVD
jgi:acetyltransferase-like isoleucine patch superfamily enzyme